MEDRFYTQPVLNSPYGYPGRHWELDDDGQPTQRIIERRRSAAEFITAVPEPRRRRVPNAQQRFIFDDGQGLSTADQQYSSRAEIVAEIRQRVDQWRQLPNPNDWRVTPETARLLRHWRDHEFSGIRPFFCQVEAVETLIWLTEVAPTLGREGRRFSDYLTSVNREANPELLRLALKMATGAGKTTVMAMIIAWQTINALRRPTSNRFTHGFLIVTPGITIKDRLRVLRPNDPDSYFTSRELVPNDMRADLERAKIVITNYHAFQLRERLELSRGGRALLEGRGAALNTKETEGQMLQRVMPELMGLKNILALNDEGHHCYREKPGQSDEGRLTGDDRQEANRNKEAARVWISGLEAVNRKLGLRQVIDLSATPFFLRGSGYAEGTLFPWTVSDFSLMDAIECGIVKLPRVPVADNIPGSDMPTYRNLWEHIRTRMPRAGRGRAQNLDPLAIPSQLESALEALYRHYEQTFTYWEKAEIRVPPCFIIVCNNTATSKLVYEYVSGFHREREDGATTFENGRLELFRNFDDSGNRLARPRTLLIDSAQLESGDALDRNFRTIAADQIERFRRERRVRTGDLRQGENISDQDLLREVTNTVGKEDRLGGQIRCVVSVSMLTEGWDANTVTHILGVRAFGTQLLCEQVIGRALRRRSYDLNDDDLFNVEYADVLGIPFDFTAKPVVVAPPKPPVRTTHVHAVSPERDDLEIEFPRVTGYRVDPPKEDLAAEFTADSVLELTPERVGPTRTRNEGIIGEGVDLNLIEDGKVRRATLLYNLTKHLLETHYRDANEAPKLHLFGKLKAIVGQWLDSYLVCKGGTYPGQLMYRELADMAGERIAAAIIRRHAGKSPIRALLDPFNPTGSTRFVNFNTSKTDLRATRKSHINWVVLDLGWESELCRIVEDHPRVRAYVKNHNLGLEVPYRFASHTRSYRPDFIVLVDDGHGDDDLLRLVVEVKGYRGEDAKVKKDTMDTYWIPGVNNLGEHGRWLFAEFTDVFEMEQEFDTLIQQQLARNEAAADC